VNIEAMATITNAADSGMEAIGWTAPKARWASVMMATAASGGTISRRRRRALGRGSLLELPQPMAACAGMFVMRSALDHPVT
jgi:hypothetical protein